MSRPELLLSNQLCFLVHRLDMGIAALYRPLLSKLNLTYTQYLAMLALWEKRELGVGELCGLLHMDTGTVSPLLKRLEALGYVERTRNRADERSVTIRLTEAGTALESAAAEVPGAIAGCLLSSQAEYEALRQVFSELLERLDGTEPDPA